MKKDYITIEGDDKKLDLLDPAPYKEL